MHFLRKTHKNRSYFIDRVIPNSIPEIGHDVLFFGSYGAQTKFFCANLIFSISISESMEFFIYFEDPIFEIENEIENEFCPKKLSLGPIRPKNKYIGPKFWDYYLKEIDQSNNFYYYTFFINMHF